jgi:hypothetical protein
LIFLKESLLIKDERADEALAFYIWAHDELPIAEQIAHRFTAFATFARLVNTSSLRATDFRNSRMNSSLENFAGT